MNNKPIIHISNLSFSYPTAKAVLSDISLTIKKGERVALVGPNGAGKTTLFLLLCGILSPSSGTITINGKNVKHNQFNTDVTYLFQSPDDQLFSSTVFDDVAFGPLNMGLSRDEVKKRSLSALEKVNSLSLKEKPPHHLSGGEKRMVALATLLSMAPEIMLLDEPTSNLDLRNRRNVIETLLTLDKTLLVSSHDLEFLLEVCDRVIILDNGKICADGTIADLLADEALMKTHHMEKPHSLFPHTHKKGVDGTPKEH